MIILKINIDLFKTVMAKAVDHYSSVNLLVYSVHYAV